MDNMRSNSDDYKSEVIKNSYHGTQLSFETNSSQHSSRKPSSAKRLKRKRAVEESKKENYDDAIWETNVDTSELYFPVLISENLKKESRKRNGPTKLNSISKLDCVTEPSCLLPSVSGEVTNLESTELESTIITTGAFISEGGIFEELSGSELPPHTVCITNCSPASTKAKIREELSHFGAVTGVQLYTASRPPVAYVTFSSKAASKACTSGLLEELGGSRVLARSSAVRCQRRKLTEAEAREASSGGRLLRMLKKKRAQSFGRQC